MTASDPNAPYRVIAELGRALSSPQRVRLLHLLCQCDRTVEELATVMGETLANISHHLQVLKQAHLVTSSRLDRRIAYGIVDDGVKEFWRRYRNFATDHLTEMRVITGELSAQRRERGGTMSRVDLLKLLRKGEVVLVDLRPREEFDAGHIEGALSIPLAELMQRLKELPKDKTVVLYCRGPLCLLGDAAQEKLADRSILARRLEDGIIDWQAAGLPIKRSAAHKPLIKRQPT
jgi:rhodanese-related sulfurtransferase/DNA-binding MarR family transcriptional regulator